MREGDKRECEAVGLTPQRAVWRSYKASIFCVTSFIDGQLATVGGMGGDFLSDIGNPWLFTTPAVEKVPKAYIEGTRAMVGRMLTMKPRLENYVHADYRQACGFLRLVGFTLGDPEPYGPKGAMFRKFWLVR